MRTLELPNNGKAEDKDEFYSVGWFFFIFLKSYESGI